jgi:hypothetical protein
MATTLDRSEAGMVDRQIAEMKTAATSQSRGSGVENRRGPSDTRGQSIVTGRVLLIGLTIALAWGMLLWLFVGGAIASFGNPWLDS